MPHRMRDEPVDLEREVVELGDGLRRPRLGEDAEQAVEDLIDQLAALAREELATQARPEPTPPLANSASHSQSP